MLRRVLAHRPQLLRPTAARAFASADSSKGAALRDIHFEQDASVRRRG